jgi:hypothetical protein
MLVTKEGRVNLQESTCLRVDEPGGGFQAAVIILLNTLFHADCTCL